MGADRSGDSRKRNQRRKHVAKILDLALGIAKGFKYDLAILTVNTQALYRVVFAGISLSVTMA